VKLTKLEETIKKNKMNNKTTTRKNGE